MRLWRENYERSPYFQDVLKILGNIGLGSTETISDLNIELIYRICDYLNISTPMMLSNELALEGSKTARLIDLLKKLNASTYLSGPSADVYLDKDEFKRAGISLEYKSYDYEPYPQQWGGFDGAVTVLDLIANLGPVAQNYIRSHTADIQVV